jgi:TRAP-type C4-dicarboxylate transport system substrate-binding protein
MKHSLKLALAIMLCSVALSFNASAKQLRYAVGFPTGAAPDAAKVYAEAAKKHTDGSISVREYELSLLSLSEMSSGIGHGIADIGYVLTPYFPAEYPHINMASEVSMLLALQEGSHGKEGLAYAGAMDEFVFLNCLECNSEFSRQNEVYPGGPASGPYGLLCNKPITTRADLQGARIRTGGAAWARWATHFGASPISMSGNEVFEALHQGVVDCAAISSTELSGLNLMDAVTHITMNVPGGVFAGGGAANINQTIWQKLTESQRKGMLRAGSVMAAETSYNYEIYGLRDLDRAREKGVTIHTADSGLVEASREYVKGDVGNIAANYSKQHGVKRADELIAILHPLVEKWTALVADVDSAETLAELYWQEVYSKVDVRKHGMGSK